MKGMWGLILGIGLLLASGMVHAATITGTAYDGLTFEPLKNTIVTIDTIPSQTKLAKDGTFSFEVAAGTYELGASYSEQGIVLMSSSQTITVPETDGKFVTDIILLPSLDDLPDTTIPPEPTFWEQILDGPAGWLVLIGVVLIAGGYAVMRVHTTIPEKKEKTAESEKEKGDNQNKIPIEKNKPIEKELDHYAWEVIHFLQRGGNRVNQKDLRESMSIGEAKVSLVVSELENYGIVKKIKRGRGNILILTEKGREMSAEKKKITNEQPSHESPVA